MSELFINTRFEPDILCLLSPTNKHTLRRWAMDPIGEPVPSMNGQAVAFWHGQWSKRGEAAVITAAAANPNRPVLDYGTRWFFGVAIRELIEAAEDTKLALADSATFVADSGQFAVDQLEEFLPRMDFC